jgi:IS5 family transposase
MRIFAVEPCKFSSKKMLPKKTNHTQGDLFKARLSSLINPNAPLIILAKKIDWGYFEREFAPLYKKNGAGSPPHPIRLMVGLLLIQYLKKLSDVEVVKQFVENVYYQAFCGYDYIPWEAPIDPSSLTRFRNRLGKKGVSKILKMTVELAIKEKIVSKKDFQKVVVDTTVMPKNITHPTDGALLDKMRKKIVKLAKDTKINLRQNYNKLAKKKLLMSGRYAHAKQYKRMKKATGSLRTYLGRIIRDVQRKTINNPDIATKFSALLDMAIRLKEQKKKDKNKIYSIHEPGVYCIAKGKARNPYEFGAKVSIVTTQKKGIVLTSEALEKNEYDGHTLKKSLEIAEKMSSIPIRKVLVDKGYKGHGVKDKQVYISGQRRGISLYMRRQMLKRSSVEAHIGHMKNEGRLGISMLKGVLGDKINASLCGAAHNLRLIIKNYPIFDWVTANISFHRQKFDLDFVIISFF